MTDGRLRLVAVTGTNGKTSVTSFIRQFAGACGTRAAAVGQRIELPDRVLPRTVVPRFRGGLRAYFHRLEEQERIAIIACEAYSSAIARGVHADIPYDCVVFTNLATDHVSVHGSAKNYRADKLQLFRNLPSGTPVLIPCGARRSDIIASVARQCGQRPVVVDWRTGEGPFAAGFMNQNVRLAVAASVKIGLAADVVEAATERLVPPPGRMSELRDPNGATVIVDFAHNPHGLSAVLRCLRERGYRRIVLVLSSKGGWGARKRKNLGAVAHRLADEVIVTDDDPRDEDPALIRAQLAVDHRFKLIAGRDRAIAYALRRVGRDEVLLIAGRGEDEYFVNSRGRLRFNDLAFVKSRLTRC